MKPKKKYEKNNYIDRLIAEYRELKKRYDLLHLAIIKYKAGTLEFKLTCPIELLEKQACYMGNYLQILEIRLEMEKLIWH